MSIIHQIDSLSNASVIPEALKPFLMILGFFLKYICVSFSHMAFRGFITERRRSTGTRRDSSNSLNTIFEYQSSNWFFRNSLRLLFTLRSIGCNLLVQLAGMFTTEILFCSNNWYVESVVWPLKASNRTIAGKLSCRPNSFLLFFTYVW